MKFSAVRIALIILSILLLIVGAAVAYGVHQDSFQNYQVNLNQPVCEQSYLVLNPGQLSTMTCNVSPSEWLSVSLAAQSSKGASTSNNNFSTYVWFNQTSSASGGNGSTILLYKTTSNYTVFSLPFVDSGLVAVEVQNNQPKPNLVRGTVAVLNNTEAVVSITTVTTPYRDLGYAVMGISLVSLYLLVWNPKKIVSSALDRI